jgi:hypothetical protein
VNFCTSCGTPRSNQDNFCEKCGKKFDSDNSTEVNVQETLHPASGWKTPYDPELEEPRDLGSSPFQGSVPRKRLMIASVAIIAIFIGSGLIGGNASDSKKSSVEIQDWLVSNGFCTNVIHSLTCVYEDDAYPQRNNLSQFYPTSYYPVGFEILIGNGIGSDYTLKESIYTDNWVIKVETNEVEFPGTFDKGREMMKQIASGLNGKLNAGYSPDDNCTRPITYPNSHKVEDEATISECKKYFPGAPKNQN